MGMDTHALSEPAFVSALEVLAANGIETRIDTGCPETGGEPGYTPTPAISNAILSYNRGRVSGLADGIVITRRRTTRRATAASSTTPPMAARPTPA